ncbi:acyl-CoA thioesterase [Aminobacter sp. HY435]|uniref:acyl-CoA thioesterase n=1 Tax=Aminobacter sp. HY435 TaxID=2970917 RepID=UPI0022B99ABB|nr:acyl-ACP thioesterase [Aminobacter sp. HY435]
MTAGFFELRDVWRGGVATWECDEMGHMNTRFYMARCMEGVAMLFGLAGLPRLFAPDTATTLTVASMHIRFLRELRAAACVHVSAGFTAIGGDSASIVAVMYNSQTGEQAATFRIEIRYAASDDGTARPWPAHFMERAGGQLVEVPAIALPRGVSDAPSATSASLWRADALNLVSVGMGAVDTAGCDRFGQMLPHAFVGAMADGVRNIITPLRQLAERHSGRPGPHFGSAALEFQVVNSGWPRAGDCYEIRAGIERADARTQSLINWMLDPFTGRSFGAMQVIAICFDLEARKLMPISAAALEELDGWVVPTLAL